MSANIPKFASFRPKPKVTSEAPQDSPKDGSTDRKLYNEASKGRRDSPPPPKRLKSETKPDSLPSKTFFRDRRGDPDIIKYGTPNRYDIPPYRRIGSGYVLGLDLTQRIDRENSSDKGIVTASTRSRQERLLIKKRALGPDRSLHVVKGNTTVVTPNADFIQMSESHANGAESDLDEDEEPDYRKIHSHSGSRAGVDPPLDLDYNNSVNELDAVHVNARLTRRTRETPGDLRAWLDLVAHQERMVRNDHQLADELDDTARTQLADIRISLLKEALKAIGKADEAQIEIHERILHEAQFTLSEPQLRNLWRETIEKLPQSVKLWLGYLNHAQSSLTLFKYETCQGVFKEFLVRVSQSNNMAPAEDVLHVFIRMTSMIHQAGYQELALAIWQAILETRIFQQDQGCTGSFEAFWESEVPRIGELGSNGWLASNPEDDAPPSPPVLSSRDSTAPIFRDFQVRESESTTILRQPGRAAHDVGDDDAFHTIFYNDIQDYIGFLPSELPVQLVLEAFLCFCGLPPLTSAAGHHIKWWSDPFLQNTALSSPFRSGDRDSRLIKDLQNFAKCSVQHFQVSPQHLFAQDFALKYFRVEPGFIRRILKLAAARFPHEEAIGEYLLAFEARHFETEAVKTAKQLIKARPTSLRLYNAYGMVEARRDKQEKADQAWGAALSMQKDKSILMTSESLWLFSNWVWAALEKGKYMEALWRLVSPRGQVPVRHDSSTAPDQEMISSACDVISASCEQGLLRNDYSSAVVATSLLALLAYLSDNMNADAALSAFAHLPSWFASHNLSGSFHAELHAQEIVRFLSYHVSSNPGVKPELIRSTLEPLLQQFPDNIMLLALYAANETRFAIDDRVRGIMHQSALQTSESTSVAGWAFVIHYEELRNELSGSTAHSIRALYTRATRANASGAHCPKLWDSYTRFELRQLERAKEKSMGKSSRKDEKKRTWETQVDKARERVKDTFYRGLRGVPWCKEFIMLAFNEARDVFTEEDLWKIYRVMQEKELRLYIDLDETL